MKKLKFFLIGVLLFISNFSYALDSVIKTPNQQHRIGKVLYKVIDGFVTIALTIVVLAYVYVGFKFVASQGEPEGIKKAKEAFWNVTIGAVILVAGVAIYKIVYATLGNSQSLTGK